MRMAFWFCIFHVLFLHLEMVISILISNSTHFISVVVHLKSFICLHSHRINIYRNIRSTLHKIEWMAQRESDVIHFTAIANKYLNFRLFRCHSMTSLDNIEASTAHDTYTHPKIVFQFVFFLQLNISTS